MPTNEPMTEPMSEPTNEPHPPAHAVDWPLVTRVVDRLIPADDYPSASQAGVVGRLASGAADENEALWASLLRPGFAALRSGLADRDLDAITDEELDRLLSRLADGQTALPWPVSPARFHAELVRVTAEQYYGSHGTAGWHMVGYSPAVRRSAGTPGPAPGPRLTTSRVHELRPTYDAIVVGVGAGGGVAAAELAANGLTVLAADRGELLSYEQIGKDHLRNFRLARYSRGRCGQCGECVGFPCPTDAKNGPYNSVLPAALATGNLTIARQARAVRILTDGSGRVSGVALLDTATGAVTEVSAGHVIIACSAIETPRLLLHSTSRHPRTVSGTPPARSGGTSRATCTSAPSGSSTSRSSTSPARTR